MQKSRKNQNNISHKRKRKITKNQKSFLLENLSSPLENWISNHPFELEIGCGKGKFLNDRAQTFSSHRFLGVDWSWKWMKIGIENSIKKNLTNVLYHREEILLFLIEKIPPNSIDICHIYFPDPWPKTRHHKRRFIKTEFLNCLYTRMKNISTVYIATDFLKYYDHIQNVIQKSSALSWKKIEHRNTRVLFCPHQSNYEIKYTQKKKMLSFIELQKDSH